MFHLNTLLLDNLENDPFMDLTKKVKISWRREKTKTTRCQMQNNSKQIKFPR